jgi:hypothetical protein
LFGILSPDVMRLTSLRRCAFWSFRIPKFKKNVGFGKPKCDFTIEKVSKLWAQGPNFRRPFLGTKFDLLINNAFVPRKNVPNESEVNNNMLLFP